MTSPHEDVVDALAEIGIDPEYPGPKGGDGFYGISDEDRPRLASLAIETLRDGAVERLRKRFPTVYGPSLESMVDAILGSPKSPSWSNAETPNVVADLQTWLDTYGQRQQERDAELMERVRAALEFWNSLPESIRTEPVVGALYAAIETGEPVHQRWRDNAFAELQDLIKNAQ